jgi:putative transposase
VARSALRYRGRKAAKDTAMIARMRDLSAQYPRYGYRRIRIFLGRDGHRMSVGRAYRLWRAAGLQLPRKRPRKRVAAARPRPQAPREPNQVWSYDFVFDHCANGGPKNWGRSFPPLICGRRDNERKTAGGVFRCRRCRVASSAGRFL